jgi:hypothetical protein
MEDRDKDKFHKIVPSQGTGQTHRAVSLDVLKSSFIADGLSAQDISDRYFLSLGQVEKIIEDHKLPELRREYIRNGLSKIQDQQVNQAQRMLDVELNFKRMRLIQLEKEIEDYMAYYSRHGDFYKRHPTTGEILKDTDGISMQLHIPNVSREIKDLKESVTLSDGLKKLLSNLDEIINGKPKGEAVGDNVIDMDEIDGLFKKRI